MLEKSVMQTCLLPSMLTKSMFIQQVFVMNSCSVQCLLRSKERGTDLVTISTFYACEERSSFFTSVFWCSADCSRRACSGQSRYVDCREHFSSRQTGEEEGHARGTGGMVTGEPGPLLVVLPARFLCAPDREPLRFRSRVTGVLTVSYLC